jgi:hypothetical protein
MPRDAAGNYTLPPGINPVVPNTDIEADWANPTMQDIANALTDSLSRTGSGGMLGPFRFSDGTNAAPGISWTNQPQAGLYRANADDFRYSINGVDILQMTPALVQINKPLAVVGGGITVSGGVTIGGVAAATVNDAIAYAIALG